MRVVLADQDPDRHRDGIGVCATSKPRKQHRLLLPHVLLHIVEELGEDVGEPRGDGRLRGVNALDLARSFDQGRHVPAQRCVVAGFDVIDEIFQRVVIPARRRFPERHLDCVHTSESMQVYIQRGSVVSRGFAHGLRINSDELRWLRETVGIQ